jgi:methylphosphotriester-DNA--protein-cysteine methyltransferase
MCNKADFMEAAGQDPRWRAVALRDRTFDGQFYYAVKTTGVYCWPSCAARKAKPENVSFYASCGDAERAGFRPLQAMQAKRAQFGSAAGREGRGNLPGHRDGNTNPKPQRDGE